MIASGIITKDDLEKPIQLDDEVRKSLPEKVQEKAKDCNASRFDAA